MASPPPNVGSIVKGTVSRIESYGAFISIEQSRLRGLLHISQLSSYKVDSVEDCLSLDDEIYVKVVQVDELEDTSSFGDERRGGPPRKRFKIALSLKYASQDGNYTDLDPTNEQYDRESRGKRNHQNDDHRRNNNSFSNNHAPSQLETSLNSQIGMGIAIDPLAAMKQATSNNNGLVLRNNPYESSQNQNVPSGSSSGSNKVLFNGYALVDDTEGEVDHLLPNNETNSNPVEDVPRKPMGRGRGATLPSWMTSNTPNNDNLGNNPDNNNDDSSRRGKKKKKRKKEEKKKKKRKHHRHHEEEDDHDDHDDHDDYDDCPSNDEEKNSKHRKGSNSSSRHKKRHKKHKSRRQDRPRSRSTSYDDYDNHDEFHKNRKSKRHSSRRDNSSDDNGEDDRPRLRHKDKRRRSQRTSNDNDHEEPMFRNVEEAKAFIAKLEKEKGGR